MSSIFFQSFNHPQEPNIEGLSNVLHQLMAITLM